jgi:hypothetical protein
MRHLLNPKVPYREFYKLKRRTPAVQRLFSPQPLVILRLLKAKDCQLKII